MKRDDIIAWGGPMRVLHAHDSDPANDIVCFCEVVGRDPFHIVGRAPKPDFTLADLSGIRFASISEASTPWLCLQEDLRRADLDPETLDRIPDNTIAENMAAFEAGEIDAVQILEPFAEMLIAGGTGHLWYEAAHRGACAYTSYYACRSTLDARPDELRRITAAMATVLQWMREKPADALAHAVAPYFPDFDTAVTARALARYQQSGIWNATPELDRNGFERLKSGLVSGGLIARDIPYDEVVDMRFLSNL